MRRIPQTRVFFCLKPSRIRLDFVAVLCDNLFGGVMKKSLKEMTLAELWELFPITLAQPQKKWKGQFERERDRLCAVLSCKPDDVRHIGSTAVGTIVAKPIVDVLVICEDPAKCSDVLENNGYIAMNKSKDRVSLNKGYTPDGYADEVFHIHLRKRGDDDEVYFCRYLRDCPDTAREYGELKKRLLEEYGRDRDGYTAAKTDFVKKYTEKAKEKYAK